MCVGGPGFNASRDFILGELQRANAALPTAPVFELHVQHFPFELARVIGTPTFHSRDDPSLEVGVSSQQLLPAQLDKTYK